MVTAVAGEAEAAANEDEASVVDSVAGEGAEWECRCRCALRTCGWKLTTLAANGLETQQNPKP